MTFTRGEKGISSAYERFLSYDEKPRERVYDDLSGGVSMGMAGANVMRELRNMEAFGQGIASVSPCETEQIEGGFAAGEIRDHAYGDGIWLFRKGRTLYARVGGSIVRIGQEALLTEEFGAVYFHEGVFYVIDGEAVRYVTGELLFGLVEQEVPVIYREVSRDGQSYHVVGRPAIFQPYVDIVLGESDEYEQILPYSIAYDRGDIQIFGEGSDEPLLAEEYTIEGSMIYFHSAPPDRYRIRLKLRDSAYLSVSRTTGEAMREIITSPSSLLSYTAGGEAYFLTWDEDAIWLIRKKKEMFSSLTEDLFTRIPVGERVNAVMPYADGYFLFTEDTVQKLQIQASNEGFAPVLSVFKQDHGSDMPGSICGFDDKILFASSHGGVFYINKFGIMESDESRKISANIEESFFAHTEEEYKNARGACAFGRYYLTVGETTYVWNYGEKLPSGAQSEANERAMVWSVCDLFGGKRFLRLSTGRLYLYDEREDALCYLSALRGESDTVPCAFETRADDLGRAGRKVPVSVSLRYRAKGPLVVRLVADGRETGAVYTLPPSEVFLTRTIHPFSMTFEKMAISVETEGFLAVERITIAYI